MEIEILNKILTFRFNYNFRLNVIAISIIRCRYIKYIYMEFFLCFFENMRFMTFV